MRGESITLSPITISRTGIVVLHGFGLRIGVERGYLTLADGRGRDRREGRFTRASRQLRRLIVLGHTGTVSLEALRWLRDVGCAFVQIDGDGTIIAASGTATGAASGLDDPRLRRAQALATVSETGVTIARDLLSRKVAGQAAILEHITSRTDSTSALPDAIQEEARNAATDVYRALAMMPDTPTLAGLRMLESSAAARYWSTWAAVPMRWAKRDTERVPEHWRTAGVRSSPLTDSPRLATTPVHAMLNYAYAVLEAETRLALLTVGLDPGIGIVHTDQRARDSLALDVMEAVRPDVDRWLLDTLRARTFAKTDFHETRQGICRLMPPLAKLIAETVPRWAAMVAPVVEAVAHRLALAPVVMPSFTGSAVPRRTSPPRTTPLTQRNRSAGRDGVRNPNRKPKGAATVPDVTLPHTCRGCGAILQVGTRTYCDACYPDVHSEQVAGAFTGAGLAVLAERRAAGIDPAHGGDAGRRRGKRNAKHVAAAAMWQRERETSSVASDEAGIEPNDPETFAHDILPGLQCIPLRIMAAATGLSEGYCSFIRRGQKVPHRRHWVALVTLDDDRTE